MFQCSGRKCGSPDVWDEVLDQVPINNGKQTTIRFMALKMAKGDNGVYTGVYVMETYTGKLLVGLNVMETKKMETGLVEIDAKMLEQQLAKHGKVAVYGIRFDTDNATLKQESFTVLDEVKQLLDAKKRSESLCRRSHRRHGESGAQH